MQTGIARDASNNRLPLGEAERVIAHTPRIGGVGRSFNQQRQYTRRYEHVVLQFSSKFQLVTVIPLIISKLRRR